jgi:signal transduction histidine kinase
MIDDRPGILLVDDRPENLVALSTVLADVGAEVATALSGNEALRRMLTRRFSVVLLDVQMPDMDGFEAAELMRSHDDMRSTPIIFVTAIDRSDHHVFRGYAAGAVDYISKPVDPDILRSKVAVFLKLHRASLELRQLERDRQAARNLESLGVLAGGIAHDFNNLLTVIMGNIAVAQLTGPPSVGGSDPLTQAAQACLRARDLARELITFSPGGAPRVAPTSGRAVVEAGLLRLPDEPSVATSLELPADLPSVLVDREQVARVFECLAQNAREAMPRGGRLVVRGVALAPPDPLPPDLAPGSYLCLTVEDSGTGIAPDVLPRIFEPYFTTKPMGSRKGTGLGLSISQSILRKHGGALTVTSNRERGTTAAVYLPTAAARGAAG